MMKIYVDFDGVICDTEDNLFEHYKLLRSCGIEVDKERYVSNFNWHQLLIDSPIIANALENIKGSLYDISILTRVHSFNEAYQKIKMLRENGLTNEIIIVPPHMKKSEVVDAKGNVLIDDQMNNLSDWYNDGGISIFFNQKGEVIDTWGKTNTEFLTIKNLECLLNQENDLNSNKILSRIR